MALYTGRWSLDVGWLQVQRKIKPLILWTYNLAFIQSWNGAMVSIKFLLVLVLLFWSIWSFNIQHPLPSSPTGICIYSLFKLFPTTRTKTVFKCLTWVPNLIFNWSVKDKISNCFFLWTTCRKETFYLWPCTSNLKDKTVLFHRKDLTVLVQIPYPTLWSSFGDLLYKIQFLFHSHFLDFILKTTSYLLLYLISYLHHQFLVADELKK